MKRFALTLSALLVLTVVAGGGDPDPAQVPELIERLALEDAEVRATAVKRLHAIGPEAKAAVPALAGLLDDNAIYERFYHPSTVSQDVQFALEAIGSEAISALVQVVAEGNMETAWRAAYVLGRIGPRAVEALPALRKRLSDPDPFVRQIIVGSLPQIDRTGTETIPLLVARLQDEDEGVRAAAAAALGEYGRKAEHVLPTLLQALQDPEPRVRGYAARALGTVGPHDNRVLINLIARLKDSGQYYKFLSSHCATCWSVASDAAEALLETRQVEAVPLLTAVLKEGLDGDDRRPVVAAIKALAELGEAAAPAVPLLVSAVAKGDDGNFTRRAAAVALARIGPAAQGAVQELRGMLQSTDESIRHAAAAALIGIDVNANPEAVEIALNSLTIRDGRIFPQPIFEVLFDFSEAAVPALPMLIDHLQGEYFLNPEVAEAVGRIGPAARSAAPILVKRLGSYLDTKYAADALVGIGPTYSVPLLMQRIEEAGREEPEDDDDREETEDAIAAAAMTLGRFGPNAQAAVPLLVALLSHDARSVRVAAAKALGKIRSQPDVTIPALTRLLRDPRPDVRAQAARSLAAFERGAADSVEPLTELLSDEYIDVRAAAARSLGELGPTARSALPALRQAADDPNPFVRSNAAAVMKRLTD